MADLDSGFTSVLLGMLPNLIDKMVRMESNSLILLNEYRVLSLVSDSYCQPKEIEKKYCALARVQ